MNVSAADGLHAHHDVRAGCIFWVKSRLLMARRGLRDVLGCAAFRRYRRVALPPDAALLARDEQPLYAAVDPRERTLELGKVQNLRVAAAAIDGIVLQPGATFSFWRATGRATRCKGYAIGRELRQGCMIATVGGGICQLTNALSRVARGGGMEIVERHRHSTAPAGFAVDAATDATVFWNYVDFRFRPSQRVRIGATLGERTLVVRLDALP